MRLVKTVPGKSMPGKNNNDSIDSSYNFQSITVSKFHFEINHDSVSGVAFLVDKSSNGTYIDDRKVAREENNALCKF